MTSPEEFREFGKAMIDYVADYLENIRDRPVLPSVKPGYLQQLVPEEAPEEPETWQVIFLFCKELCLEGLNLIFCLRMRENIHIIISLGCDG